MLKPYVVAVAALSAIVGPAMGAQLAVAAEPFTRPHATALKPNVTPSPSPSAADDMAGMNHEGMPDATHDDSSGMNEEDMPGMAHDQPADLHDEEMPGMNHGESSGSHEEASGGSSATPAGEEEEEGHGSHGEETVTEPRPVAALVGAFAAVNGGVMISAAVLRRRDKHRARTSPKPARLAK